MYSHLYIASYSGYTGSHIKHKGQSLSHLEYHDQCFNEMVKNTVGKIVGAANPQYNRDCYGTNLLYVSTSYMQCA